MKGSSFSRARAYDSPNKGLDSEGDQDTTETKQKIYQIHLQDKNKKWLNKEKAKE